MNRRRCGKLHRDSPYWLLLFPSLAGMLTFFILPFAFSLYYALIDNMASRSFIGFRNFSDALQNDVFRLAASNTSLFLFIAVPLSMGLALVLAMGLRKMSFGKAFASVALLVPFVVPSGTAASFWSMIFGDNGLWIRMLIELGVDHSHAVNNMWHMGVIIVVFLWKNTGFNIVLFYAGLNLIPKTYYEAASIEGAGGWKRFIHITIPYLSPTMLIVLLMSVVNSFRVFREIYILYGAYPPQEIYMLQHYINNQFTSLNMQRLATAAYLLFMVISVFLLIIFRLQKRVTDAVN
jgi:multiple sugar transport system permease protein